MKNIGKYNGIPCYECTNVEWKDRYDRGQDNGKQIFIIDGVMVHNNKIVGYYDGKHVRDVYDEQPYFVEMWKTETAHEVSPTTGEDEEPVSYEEVVAKEIHFSDYSRVVDEFFALLE